MERKDWVMLGGFVGTILTILVVFFIGLQIMNSRFEAIENRLEAIENRLEAIENRLEAIDGRLEAVENRLLSIEEHLRASKQPSEDPVSTSSRD